MPIYQPELILTKDDCEALALLGQLAINSEGGGSNVGRDIVQLSPSEAGRLLTLLEQFAASKLFVEGSYFSEQIGNGRGFDDDRLKRIYLSWRSRRGFTNVFSGQSWREFIFRAGFNSNSDAWMWPHSMSRSPLRPMPLKHFLRMENHLATYANLHPRIKNLILQFVESALPSIESMRNGKLSIPEGAVGLILNDFIRDLSYHIDGREKTPMTRRRVIAVSTIVMDTAALFATRDWTAAGVLSTLAAAAPDAINIGS